MWESASAVLTVGLIAPGEHSFINLLAGELTAENDQVALHSLNHTYIDLVHQLGIRFQSL